MFQPQLLGSALTSSLLFPLLTTDDHFTSCSPSQSVSHQFLLFVPVWPPSVRPTDKRLQQHLKSNSFFYFHLYFLNFFFFCIKTFLPFFMKTLPSLWHHLTGLSPTKVILFAHWSLRLLMPWTHLAAYLVLRIHWQSISCPHSQSCSRVLSCLVSQWDNQSVG